MVSANVYQEGVQRWKALIVLRGLWELHHEATLTAQEDFFTRCNIPYRYHAETQVCWVEAHHRAETNWSTLDFS